MANKDKYFQRVVLILGISVVLACSSISISDGGGPDPSAVQTEIAFGIMSTSLANNQMTLQALQVQMTQQAASFTNMANAIRALTMDAVQAANIGHPGMPGSIS